MRILFLGDVVGRAGRDAVAAHLPELKARLATDIVVINGENAAGGYGINEKIAAELYAAGADAITLGNHVWDQKDLIGTIDRDPRMVRPANFPEGTPGRGATVIVDRSGRKLLVVNVMLRLFMDALDDPFAYLDRLVKQHRLGGPVQGILVDMHGEASSEKQALGHFLDGRVSLVVGTHTHVPTADHRILPGGTAFMTDAGMCGDYDSVIGMKKEPATARFVRKMPIERLGPGEGEGTISGVMVDIDDRSGLATRVAPVRVGPGLSPTVPDA
jgi:2',3'-cyclic-nucleotide 2'-phosphodiesterase